MRKAIIPAFLLLLGSMVLGATVLREPIARAAGSIPTFLIANDKQHAIRVREQNLDANGNMKVHEQGTANVNVTNTGPLSVSNVNDPAQQPFRADLFQADDSYTVPAGKRLVIQEVEGLGEASGDHASNSAVFRLDIGDNRPLFFASDGVSFTDNGITATTEWYMTEQATAYAEAGEKVSHSFFVRGVPSTAGFGEMVVIGYLIDV